MTQNEDAFFMAQALEEAKKAAALDEVPVGAVIVREGAIIARGHNLKEQNQDATLHGEMIAIRAASRKLGAWRLTDTTIYVTLEPCPMCAGAMLQARIGRLVYAAPDPKSGAAGSVVELLRCPGMNHQIEVVSGLMEEEAALLLREFFRNKRQKAAAASPEEGA